MCNVCKRRVLLVEKLRMRNLTIYVYFYRKTYYDNLSNFNKRKEFRMTKNKISKILWALFGIMLVSFGVAFNAGTLFGNDPVGIIYDGIRSVANLSPEKLGFVSNFVNYGLIIFLLFVGRKYINIGTFVYIIPYGFFVSIGTKIYEACFVQEVFASRLLAAVIGCSFVYIGVGIYIAMDIGLDPFTGVVMVLADTLKWEYQKAKICFDLTMIVLGTVLGGKLGVITIVTALTAGPCIQAVSKLVKSKILKEKMK